MFWTFLLILFAAIGLLKLGAYSVWYSITQFLLTLGGLLLAGVALFFGWKWGAREFRSFGRRPANAADQEPTDAGGTVPNPRAEPGARC